jgi:hypothetical protein
MAFIGVARRQVGWEAAAHAVARHQGYRHGYIWVNLDFKSTYKEMAARSAVSKRGTRDAAKQIKKPSKAIPSRAAQRSSRGF